MLANMAGDDITVLLIGVDKNVLNEVVAELVARDVDKRHARTFRTSFTHAVEIAIHEGRSSDLQTLFNDF